MHLSALHRGAVTQMGTSPLLNKPPGPFKNLSQQRDISTPSQQCTKGCFDKMIVSIAQVDGGFWKKSRDFQLHLTSPTQAPPFCSKQKCYFPSLSLPFFFPFPEGINIQDRKEHKWTNKQKAKRNYFCIESCRKKKSPLLSNGTEQPRKFWEKLDLMGETHGTKQIFFTGNVLHPSSPCTCATCPESRDQGHKLSSAIRSILEITLHAERNTSHRLM